jgi:hypothetical protein
MDNVSILGKILDTITAEMKQFEVAHQAWKSLYKAGGVAALLAKIIQVRNSLIRSKKWAKKS